MASKLVYIFLFLPTFVMAYTHAAREVPNWNSQHSFKSTTELDEATNGTLGDCWSAITEIKSCGNEISAYFKNGAIDISLPCCKAIKLIAQHCWPAMLTAIGITPDQCNILVGYCDASAPNGPAPGPNNIATQA